ncbi:hypothetical protein GWK18_05065 [Kocuria sp. JC486]|uniref:hypothetical protein n=1 Tax=Kocuria sp. JC486 TaxID=1970736 RepID=UPI00142251E3|nr:hypothetical protein [Kocuria sp. JC486]NHU84969.1 hypothetical protein [Kocuria sp. JC486]
MVTPAHTPPAGLRGRCFTTAEAYAHGVTRGQLLGPGYVSVFRNVWAVAGHVFPADPVEHLMDLLPAVQLAYPGTAASHTTAALVLGLRVPGRLRLALPIHLTPWTEVLPPRVKGLRGHRSWIPPQDRVLQTGVGVTGPVRTLVDLAGAAGPRGPWFLDQAALVSVLDGVICEHRYGPLRGVPPLRAREAVAEDLARMTGLRGVARVRSALALARPGVDSAAETRARLVLQDNGLGEWVTDLELRAPGHRSVWPDLARPEDKVSLQIEGPHHDADRQRVRDIERQRATEAAGWIEVRVLISDLYPRSFDPPGTPPRVVDLVREAIARRRRG